eukprot:Nitzschia sp. Nitz4//scaffold18_size181773//28064//29113//NITZ4_001899-RA/size181773-processed-gene-0.188-mRNA-1//1//CDS//3329539963//1991//frame0
MILNRWRRMGMYIIEWKDEDYWKPPAEYAVSEGGRPLLSRHRRRQPLFMGACAQRAKLDNRTWVALYDNDEFLVVSHKGGKDFEASDQRIQEYHESTRFVNITRLQPPRRPPITAEPGSILPFIQDAALAGLEYYNGSCIMVPRILFGGQDPNPGTAPDISGLDRALISKVIDPIQLDTLRYLTHAAWYNKDVNGNGKGLLDVSRIDKIPSKVEVHAAIKDICPKANLGYWQSILTLNHYLGSWETFTFRNDSRSGGERSLMTWTFKSTEGMEYTDDTICAWIQGFIQSVGIEKARELLQGAGLPPRYQYPKNTTVDPEYLADILNSKTRRRHRAFAEDWQKKYAVDNK